MDGCTFGAAVVNCDEHVHVRRIGSSVFDEDVKIAIFSEDAGIQQLVFWLLFSSRAVGLNKLSVGEFPLRILVEHFQVSMSGGGVQIVIELFAIFAVVAFAVGQSEQTFLEDGVACVPEGQRKAESLVMIGKSGDAILAPPVGATAGMIMGQITPRVAVCAVIFTYRPPLPLAKIGSPLSPKPVLRFVALLLLDSKKLAVDYRIGFCHGRIDSIRRAQHLIGYTIASLSQSPSQLSFT